jgi:folate-binding protein YgfZ
MNSNWLDFLSSQGATFLENDKIQFSQANKSLTSALYPIPQLSILEITGGDSLTFLQGQLTCNVKELREDNSFFAAFCNAKGRTISTLLIFKQAESFFLVLPTVLKTRIQKKLQMYVLRSNVQLIDVNDDYCISGLHILPESLNDIRLPYDDFSREHELIKLPNSSYLMIATVENSVRQWSECLKKGLFAQSSWLWNYLDISAGLAWLDDESSEVYIPQMLNLDKLGGISFDKGCYTGQEVVARTHYLGKAKRELFIAECTIGTVFEENNINNENGKSIAKVIKSENFVDKQRLLIVMSIAANEESFPFEKEIKLLEEE